MRENTHYHATALACALLRTGKNCASVLCVCAHARLFVCVRARACACLWEWLTRVATAGCSCVAGPTTTTAYP